MSRARPGVDELFELHHRMNRLFDAQGGRNGEARLWKPAVDVYETEGAIILLADLPGMKKDDIEIQLTDGVLTLSGERRLEATERGEQYHRIERQHGKWQRSFRIETPVDAARVAATYEDGVLTVTLPKQASVKPRQIAIDVVK